MKNKKLKVSDLGKDVAKLQEMLKAHGFGVSGEEHQRQFFGPSTRSAVGTFQKQHGIDPTCEACETTIAVLGQTAISSTTSFSISETVPTTTPTSGAAHQAAVPKAVDSPSDGIISTGSSTSSDSPSRDGAAGRGEYKISGRVAKPDGRGIPKLIMQAFHKILRGEEYLSAGMTNARGDYVIYYQSNQLGRSGKRPCGLMVKAYTQRGDE